MKSILRSKKLDKLVLSRDRMALDPEIYWTVHDNMRPEDAFYAGVEVAERAASSNVPVYQVVAFDTFGEVLFFRGELEALLKRISKLPKAGQD